MSQLSQILTLILLAAACICTTSCSGLSRWKTFYEAGVQAHSSGNRENNEDQLYEAAIRDAKSFGVPHAEYRPAETALATYRFNQNKYSEAEKLYEQLLEADVHDQNTDASLDDLSNLYTVCEMKDDHKKAKDYAVGGFELSRAKLGPRSESTVRWERMLATSELKLKQPADAITHITDAIDTARSIHMDATDIDVLEALHARALHQLKKPKEALAIYDQLLQRRYAQIGSNNLLDMNTRDALVQYVGIQHELHNDAAAKAAVAKYAPKLSHLGSPVGISEFGGYLKDYETASQ